MSPSAAGCAACATIHHRNPTMKHLSPLPLLLALVLVGCTRKQTPAETEAATTDVAQPPGETVDQAEATPAAEQRPPEHDLVQCEIPEEDAPSDEPVVSKPDGSRLKSEMRAVLPAMRECTGPDGGGIMPFRVIVGKDGRPTHVEAMGKLSGTEIGNCAAQKICAARFPPLEKVFKYIYPCDLRTPEQIDAGIGDDFHGCGAEKEQ